MPAAMIVADGGAREDWSLTQLRAALCTEAGPLRSDVSDLCDALAVVAELLDDPKASGDEASLGPALEFLLSELVATVDALGSVSREVA